MIYSGTQLFFNNHKMLNVFIQNTEDILVSISLPFNYLEITSNDACVPTGMQDSYLPDFMDYYSGDIDISKLMQTEYCRLPILKHMLMCATSSNQWEMAIVIRMGKGSICRIMT